MTSQQKVKKLYYFENVGECPIEISDVKILQNDTSSGIKFDGKM